MKPKLNTLDTRLTSLCVAALVLVASAARPARAQECASDDDCEDDFVCQRDDGGGAIDSDARPCIADAGACEPAPEPVEPVEEPLGRCVARPITCESDADCPAGLSCELHRSEQCSVSRPVAADAGTAEDVPDCTVTTETTGECVFELEECDDDADCAGDLVCTAIGAERSCSGEPGTAMCPPGAECPEPQPAPEPECSEPVIHSYCFPEPMTCEADADCDAGTRCVELPNDWEEEDDDAPMGWQGVTKACFPEAFALAIEGSVGVAGGGTAHDEAGLSGTDSAGGSADGAPSGDPKGADADESSADQSGSGSGNDCAVAAPGAQREGLGWPHALALSGLWLARRRRASRLKRA